MGCKYLIRSPVFTAFVVAVVFLGLSASTASAYVQQNKYFRVPDSILSPEFTQRPDPTKVRPGPPTKEPPEAHERVHRCWGYLGNNHAVGWVKLFFLNGTLPSANVCQGVLNLHRDCWPDMFYIWWFVDAKRIGHLHNHCVKTAALGAHGYP